MLAEELAGEDHDDDLPGFSLRFSGGGEASARDTELLQNKVLARFEGCIDASQPCLPTAESKPAELSKCVRDPWP